MTTRGLVGRASLAALLGLAAGIAPNFGANFSPDGPSRYTTADESTRFDTRGGAQHQVTPEQKQAKAIRDGGWRYGRPGGHRRGPGWTQAQVQRRARKIRNRARNKAAHRG